MYSPRLYKYKDSYVLYIPITVHAFGSVLLTHTHDVSAPWVRHGTFEPFFCHSLSKLWAKLYNLV